MKFFPSSEKDSWFSEFQPKNQFVYTHKYASNWGKERIKDFPSNDSKLYPAVLLSYKKLRNEYVTNHQTYNCVESEASREKKEYFPSLERLFKIQIRPSMQSLYPLITPYDQPLTAGPLFPLLQINTPTHGILENHIAPEQGRSFRAGVVSTMDNLIMHMRGRHSSGEPKKKEESSSGKDRSIPPQKTESFKDKKKGQNWFQRLNSRQMNQDYSSDGEIEHAAALAASAFAISSLTESMNIPHIKQARKEPGTSSIPIKSRKDDSPSKRFSFPFSFSGQDSKRSSDNQDSKLPITAATDAKTPEKAIVPASSIKKTTSFAPEKATPPAHSLKSFLDKPSNNTVSNEPGSATPKRDLPTTVKPAPPLPPPPPPSETKRQRSISPEMGKTKADAWEEAELAKIKERYEKLQTTILSWENKKKMKAKSRRDRTEGEVESKRKKALEKYNSEMKYIDQVAGGARAQAEERHRNEVLKAKEKANVIRKTGQVPTTCFCF